MEFLEDIEHLDALLKTWYQRRELVYMHAETMRTEAYSHGIGKQAVYGRMTTVLWSFLGLRPWNSAARA